MRRLGIAFLLLFFILIVWVQSWLFIPTPKINNTDITQYPVDTLDEQHLMLHKNFINKNEGGLWELYTEGSPFDIGYSTGVLAKELLDRHEEAYIKKITEKSPIKNKYAIRAIKSMYNRHLDNRILPEYCEEMYGLSKSANPKYNAYGSAYQRILNYHSLYDIERNFDEVEVNSSIGFVLTGNKTYESNILVGRNFEFEVHPDFQKEKLIHFVKPLEGFKFASITWGGFVGTVSGMNEMGLTVSTNPVESDIPTKATMPMSLITREILQYAMTVEEAFNIALTKEAYVSETILVASAFDSTAIIIEKTPDGIDSIQMRTNELIATNHLQTEKLRENRVYDPTYASYYKSIRIQELINNKEKFTVPDIASILRDTKGFENTTIGLGNKKSINSLNLHHSVIFKPNTREMWVSADHRQLDQFICYNLDSVFIEAYNYPPKPTLASSNKYIPRDHIKDSQEYRNYQSFQTFAQLIEDWTPDLPRFQDKELLHFRRLNPDSYLTYELLGDYFAKMNDWDMAQVYYKIALDKEVSTFEKRKAIENKYLMVSK
ncbi:C45 family peptidase [Flammeovirga sp. SubArs3]|uniref:C45 family autoproteolytic acyltransferase/hydolase n=1 Tax=Flammeovirga sp. SubArs3 TaxID=2995316 RepID=UPI00248D2637|nr:C45 family peptidase [Flammeovirga sp. SubArs3]